MKIASWNVEGRLTLSTKKRRGTPEKILDMIEEIGADVIVLPEAYNQAPAPGVDERLAEMGYAWRDVKYDERNREFIEGLNDNLYIRILAKLEIIKTEALKWNDIRGLVSITVKDPVSSQSVRFIATHLDERKETSRLMQLKEAVTFINSSNLPTVMLGDFNAMHDDARSRFIRSRLVRVLASLILHHRIKGRVQTLMGMAEGSSLKFLESKTSLRDIDPKHRPTTTPKLREMEWMPSIRLAQIDHIFVSSGIRTTDFKVFEDGGSDHRAISADIAIKSL